MIVGLALLCVLPACFLNPVDCSEGPQSSTIKDEDLGGNSIDSAPGAWCGVQYAQNEIALALKYIIPGQTEDAPIHFNWTFPEGSTVVNGGDGPYPRIRLGKVSGDITVQAESSCGKSNVARRHLDVLSTNATTVLPEFSGSKRMQHAGFALDGKGYVVAGISYPLSPMYFKDVWQFDPATLGWTQLPDAPREGTAVATTVGDRAYVAITGPDTTGAVLYSFQPPSTWTKIGPVPYAGFATFATAAAGEVFFGADEKPPEVGSPPHGVVWRFDPGTSQWTKVAQLESSYAGVRAVGLGDRLFIGGGCYDCQLDGPRLQPGFGEYNAATGQLVAGGGFQLSGMRFEAWAFSDAVLLWRESGTYLFTPATGLAKVNGNVAMVCSLPGSSTGEIGRATFAIGDGAYRVMGAWNPPNVPLQVKSGVERYVR